MAFPKRLLAGDEEIVLDLRPHWMALVAPGIWTIALLLVFIFGLRLLPDTAPSLLRWGLFLIVLIVFASTPLPKYLAWATSHFVVTSGRVIHRFGLVAKHSTEIPLESVSDVEFGQGMLERLVGSGDLTIESPGENGQTHFVHVRNPEHVQKTLYELIEAVRRNAPSGARGSVTPISVADELAKLDRLRQQGIISEEEFRAQKSRLLGPN